MECVIQRASSNKELAPPSLTRFPSSFLDMVFYGDQKLLLGSRSPQEQVSVHSIEEFSGSGFDSKMIAAHVANSNISSLKWYVPSTAGNPRFLETRLGTALTKAYALISTVDADLGAISRDILFSLQSGSIWSVDYARDNPSRFAVGASRGVFAVDIEIPSSPMPLVSSFNSKLYTNKSDAISVQIASDGNRILAGCRDGFVRVFDRRQENRPSGLAMFPVPPGWESSSIKILGTGVFNLRLLKDELRFISSSFNGKVGPIPLHPHPIFVLCPPF